MSVATATTTRIVYASSGPKYFVDDREVTEAEYRATCNPRTIPDMLASGRAPYIATDATFMIGQWDKGITGTVNQKYRQMAKRAGVSPDGRVYKSSLARFPGDPQAWVDGRADVKRICESNGWECEGRVNVKARQPEREHKAVDVADDLLEAEVNDIIATAPEPVKESRRELKEKVREKRKRSK